MKYYKLCVLSLLLLTLPSCNLVDRAKAAAGEWWKENRQSVVTSVADTASKFWEENKSSLFDSVKKFLSDNKEEALAAMRDLASKAIASAVGLAKTEASELAGKLKTELMSYTDAQIESRMQSTAADVTAALTKHGIDPMQYDANHDGSVSPDELAQGLMSDPSSLLAGGAPAILLLLLFFGKRLKAKAAPAAKPSAPSAQA